MPRVISTNSALVYSARLRIKLLSAKICKATEPYRIAPNWPFKALPLSLSCFCGKKIGNSCCQCARQRSIWMESRWNEWTDACLFAAASYLPTCTASAIASFAATAAKRSSSHSTKCTSSATKTSHASCKPVQTSLSWDSQSKTIIWTKQKLQSLLKH